MGIDGELSLDPAVRKVLKWDTPEPPTLDTRYFYRNSTHRTTREPIRMRHIPLREDIKGIIASILMDLTDCNSVNSLYALYEGSDPKPIYSRQHLDGHSQRWFFFPIAGNERVSEVWVQIRKSWSDPGRWHKPSIAVSPVLLSIFSQLIFYSSVLPKIGLVYSETTLVPRKKTTSNSFASMMIREAL